MENNYKMMSVCDNCGLEGIITFPTGKRICNVERLCPFCGCDGLQIGDRVEETKTEVGIGMLRQWLNDDRITDPSKIVTNEDIKKFLK